MNSAVFKKFDTDIGLGIFHESSSHAPQSILEAAVIFINAHGQQIVCAILTKAPWERIAYLAFFLGEEHFPSPCALSTKRPGAQGSVTSCGLNNLKPCRDKIWDDLLNQQEIATPPNPGLDASNNPS